MRSRKLLAGAVMTYFGFIHGEAVGIGGGFGVTPAVFQFWSDSVLTATAPPGVGVVQLTVRTKLGFSATGPASQFTYAAIPAVAQLTPASGPVAGGNLA